MLLTPSTRAVTPTASKPRSRTQSNLSIQTSKSKPPMLRVSHGSEQKSAPAQRKSKQNLGYLSSEHISGLESKNLYSHHPVPARRGRRTPRNGTPNFETTGLQKKHNGPVIDDRRPVQYGPRYTLLPFLLRFWYMRSCKVSTINNMMSCASFSSGVSGGEVRKGEFVERLCAALRGGL